MDKKIIMPLTPVNHYSRLPEQESIRLFQKLLADSAQTNQPLYLRQCSLAARDIKDAYLIASLCFGQLKILDNLEEIVTDKKIISSLKQKLSQFSWRKQNNAFKNFQYNSVRLGKLYPLQYQKLYSQVRDRIQNIFIKDVKQSQLLYGVKIRKWKQDNPQLQYYTLKRQNQQGQLKFIQGNQYLLFAQTKTGSCNLCMLYLQNINIHSTPNLHQMKQKSNLSTPIKLIQEQFTNLTTTQMDEKYQNNQSRTSQGLIIKTFNVQDVENKQQLQSSIKHIPIKLQGSQIKSSQSHLSKKSSQIKKPTKQSLQFQKIRSKIQKLQRQSQRQSQPQHPTQKQKPQNIQPHDLQEKPRSRCPVPLKKDNYIKHNPEQNKPNFYKPASYNRSNINIQSSPIKQNKYNIHINAGCNNRDGSEDASTQFVGKIRQNLLKTESSQYQQSINNKKRQRIQISFTSPIKKNRQYSLNIKINKLFPKNREIEVILIQRIYSDQTDLSGCRSKQTLCIRRFQN